MPSKRVYKETEVDCVCSELKKLHSKNINTQRNIIVSLNTVSGPG